MWIMSCSASNVRSEHHSEAGAREHMAVHVIGSKALGWGEKYHDTFLEIKPCYAEHTVEDDGKQCTNPGGCKIPYIRADGRYQYVV